LTERFPTEVRGTASAFCYHFGTILGGLVPPAVTFLAVDKGMGFPQPMLYGTILGALGCGHRPDIEPRKRRA
jgi:MFS transporter, SHS family, lactate transporter